jgi:hypothetical protein
MRYCVQMSVFMGGMMNKFGDSSEPYNILIK